MFSVLGIGVDLCEIARIRRALEKPRFAQRVYTEAERETIAARGAGGSETAAALFAGKEAVAKALGTGFAEGVTLQDICITHDAAGAPQVSLSGGALARLQALGGGRVLLSLTHEGNMAAAFAVLEG